LLFKLLFVQASLVLAGRRKKRYEDVSDDAFDFGIESSLQFLEKGGAARSAFYEPTCRTSSTFGACNLADFDVQYDRILGSGGYGKVFLGKHRPTGKTVALKQISWDIVNPRHVQHEETIHHRLNHPYIAKFHCTMKDAQGNLYFAIEYIPGKNLGRRLSERGREKVPRSTIQKYMAEIILALRYIHAQCIVYRDLKASNILVSKSGHIKLIDFGLSVYDCENNLKGFAGTLEYAAPEMAAHNYYGRAVDYYSLGILLFRMVTGKLPLSRQQVGLEKPEFLALVARGFPFPSSGDKIADDLIAHLCDRNPHTRYGVREDSHKLIQNHPFFSGFHWSSVKSPVTGSAKEDYASTAGSFPSGLSRTLIPLDRLWEYLDSDDESS